MLVRPVHTYTIPHEEQIKFDWLFFPNNSNQNIKLKTIKRTIFKDREHIKSNNGVYLLQTFIILHLKEECSDRKTQIEFILIPKTKRKYQLRISSYEIFNLKALPVKNNEKNIIFSRNCLIKNHQFIYSNTVILETIISSPVSGTIIDIQQDRKSEIKKLVFLKESNLKEVYWSSLTEKLQIKLGDLVRTGSLLTNFRKSNYSGRVSSITANKILIRIGHPYLISKNTILKTFSGTFIEYNEILATLVYEKLKTIDIVQGLPKIEEILEARNIKNSCLLAPSEGHLYIRNSIIEIIRKDNTTIRLPITMTKRLEWTNGDFIRVAYPVTNGQINPHKMLEILFKHYKKTLSIAQACNLSFKYLQLFLVNEVQRTYLAQGVQITGKHIEVIVKQMTSKVQIERSRNTGLLPGEIISLSQAERIVKTDYFTKDMSLRYVPILLGLTKASLRSDSFLSAASFQATTRILTEAAIEGKKD